MLAEAFSSQLIFTIFFRQNACFKNPEEIFTAGQCFLCYKVVRKYFDFEEKIIIECPCWLKDIKPLFVCAIIDGTQLENNQWGPAQKINLNHGPPEW